MPDTPESKATAAPEQKQKATEQSKPTATEPKDQKGSPDASNDSKSADGFAPAIEAAKAAKRLQDTADALKKQASLMKDPAEREHLIRSAYEKEIQAHGQSKKARAMASGWGQGAVAGVGIAGAVGMGLGNLVGVLLSGVTAVPGVLVGSGVGAAHGPWFKLGGGGGGKKNGDGKDGGEEGEAKSAEDDDSDDEEAHRAIVEAARQAEDAEAEANPPSGNAGDGETAKNA
jgi:hypothetical protein